VTSLSGSSILVQIGTVSTAAAIYTVSGATVTTATAVTGPATVTVTTGGTSCGADLKGIAAGLVVFGVAPVISNAIAGVDADGTAIAEMEAAFPPGTSCPTSHAVVLATDQTFPDALAASYLAGDLGTGILLTPTAALSAETQTALQEEGITSVYVVGGPLAISQNTINEVNATPAYTCGGPNNGGTKTTSDITVVQTLAGQTQYDTAQQIANFPAASHVRSFNLSGAYAGQYNDTTGNESSTASGTGALRTAIVATGASFQDAAGASVLAYANQFPVVLTDPNSLSPEASTTLQSLGITQAIVLGGPLAVSAGDVTSIQALGISVIRVAGQDATDTAQELATLELQSTSSAAGLGWSSGWGNKILVARGDFYSDALAGCVLASIAPTPLLLTENPGSVGQYLGAFLNQGGSAAGIDGQGANGNIQTIQPLGGSLALFFTTLQAMAGDVAAG
jgi:putative cell wall-binding protein